jgi:hypothetical protein
MSSVFHRWTKEMEAFLIDVYEYVGDYLIAEEMNERFPHEYPWNKKHIEKKRGYLGLRRTKDQEMFLRWFANAIINKSQKKAWDTRGRMKIGEVRLWKDREYIKTNMGVTTLAIHTWTIHNGTPPKGANICIKDKTKTAGEISNLELVMNEDLGIRNKHAQYPQEIRTAAINLSKLKRRICHVTK